MFRARRLQAIGTGNPAQILLRLGCPQALPPQIHISDHFVPSAAGCTCGSQPPCWRRLASHRCRPHPAHLMAICFVLSPFLAHPAATPKASPDPRTREDRIPKRQGDRGTHATPSPQCSTTPAHDGPHCVTNYASRCKSCTSSKEVQDEGHEFSALCRALCVRHCKMDGCQQARAWFGTKLPRISYSAE